MAKKAQGYEVVESVAPTLTAEQPVMNLQPFARAAVLASPPVPPKHFNPQAAVGCRIQSYSKFLTNVFFHHAFPMTREMLSAAGVEGTEKSA
jgi:hypothetical protein